jgi:hypothetical protein
VSVWPPLLTTCELIFDQVLFEISRQFVVVYKGVQVNDTIQVVIIVGTGNPRVLRGF